MTTDLIRRYLERSPFEAFTICMNSGQSFAVEAPDDLFMPRGWSANALVTLEDDAFAVIYLRNVSHVISRGPWPKFGRRSRRSDGGHDDS